MPVDPDQLPPILQLLLALRATITISHQLTDIALTALGAIQDEILAAAHPLPDEGEGNRNHLLCNQRIGALQQINDQLRQLLIRMALDE